MADGGNIEPTRRDVRADEEADFAILELVQGFHALPLFHVAVQGGGIVAVPLERPVQDADVAFSVAEQQCVLDHLGAQEGTQGGALVARSDHRHRLLHGFRDRSRRRHRNLLRLAQEAVGQPTDFRGHGGREEQRLVLAGDESHDALDIRDEPHVEHAVGLVDHQEPDVVHQHLAALEVVEQTAWRRDQHVDTAVQLLFLVGERDAADQQRGGQARMLAVALEALLHLGRQLARRLEDQRPWHARLGAALAEDIDHRQREPGGLAGAGLCAAQHVAPHQDLGDRLFLDRSGLLVSGLGDCAQHALAQAQFGKAHMPCCFSPASPAAESSDVFIAAGS